MSGQLLLSVMMDELTRLNLSKVFQGGKMMKKFLVTLIAVLLFVLMPMWAYCNEQSKPGWVVWIVPDSESWSDYTMGCLFEKETWQVPVWFTDGSSEPVQGGKMYQLTLNYVIFDNTPKPTPTPHGPTATPTPTPTPSQENVFTFYCNDPYLMDLCTFEQTLPAYRYWTCAENNLQVQLVFDAQGCYWLNGSFDFNHDGVADEDLCNDRGIHGTVIAVNPDGSTVELNKIRQVGGDYGLGFDIVGGKVVPSDTPHNPGNCP